MSLPVNPPPGPVSLSQNARTVLEKRYLVKNEGGQAVEQPEDLFWRVSTVVAGAGTAAVMAGGRNPATLPSGTPVTVRLQKPATVTVER